MAQHLPKFLRKCIPTYPTAFTQPLDVSRNAHELTHKHEAWMVVRSLALLVKVQTLPCGDDVLRDNGHDMLRSTLNEYARIAHHYIVHVCCR